MHLQASAALPADRVCLLRGAAYWGAPGCVLPSAIGRRDAQPTLAPAGAGTSSFALGSLTSRTPPTPVPDRCRELVLGCCAADWLKAASREELARGAGGADRLPGLAVVAAQQRK